MRKHVHTHARPGATAIDTTHGDTTLHRHYHHNPHRPPTPPPPPHRPSAPHAHTRRRPTRLPRTYTPDMHRLIPPSIRPIQHGSPTRHKNDDLSGSATRQSLARTSARMSSGLYGFPGGPPPWTVKTSKPLCEVSAMTTPSRAAASMYCLPMSGPMSGTNLSLGRNTPNACAGCIIADETGVTANEMACTEI